MRIRLEGKLEAGSGGKQVSPDVVVSRVTRDGRFIRLHVGGSNEPHLRDAHTSRLTTYQQRGGHHPKPTTYTGFVEMTEAEIAELFIHMVGLSDKSSEFKNVARVAARQFKPKS